MPVTTAGGGAAGGLAGAGGSVAYSAVIDAPATLGLDPGAVLLSTSPPVPQPATVGPARPVYVVAESVAPHPGAVLQPPPPVFAARPVAVIPAPRRPAVARAEEPEPQRGLALVRVPVQLANVVPAVADVAQAEAPPPDPGRAVASAPPLVATPAPATPAFTSPAQAEAPPPHPGGFPVLTTSPVVFLLPPAQLPRPWVAAAEAPPPYPGGVTYSPPPRVPGPNAPPAAVPFAEAPGPYAGAFLASPVPFVATPAKAPVPPPCAFGRAEEPPPYPGALWASPCPRVPSGAVGIGPAFGGTAQAEPLQHAGAGRAFWQPPLALSVVAGPYWAAAAQLFQPGSVAGKAEVPQ